MSVVPDRKRSGPFDPSGSGLVPDPRGRPVSHDRPRRLPLTRKRRVHLFGPFTHTRTRARIRSHIQTCTHKLTHTRHTTHMYEHVNTHTHTRVFGHGRFTGTRINLREWAHAPVYTRVDVHTVLITRTRIHYTKVGWGYRHPASVMCDSWDGYGSHREEERNDKVSPMSLWT